MKLLSDEEVFGSGSDLLTDDEVFGVAKQPQQPRDAFEAAKHLARPDAEIDALTPDYGQDPRYGAPSPSKPAPAPAPVEQKPFRDKREAIDMAVDDIELGANPDEVFAQYGKIGVTKDEIIARGTALKGKAFTPDTRPVVVREGAREGQMKANEPTTTEGIINFGKRVAERAGQTTTGVLANTGILSPETAAGMLSKSQKRMEAAAPGAEIQQGLEDLSGAKTFGELLDVIIKNPGRSAAATGAVVAESAALFIPVIAAAAATGLPALGLAGVTGATSLAFEFGGALTESLGEKGIDAKDVVAVEAALNNPEFMDDVRERGLKRGLTIGAIDALSAGIAGKFLNPVVKQIRAGLLAPKDAVLRTASAATKELAVQAGAGAGGEAAGQALTGEFKPFDIAVEAIGEVATAPLETSSNLRSSGTLARTAGSDMSVEDAMILAIETGQTRKAATVGDTGAPAPAAKTTFSDPAGPAAQAGIRPIEVPLAQAAANGQAKAAEEAAKVAEGGKPTEAMTAKVNPDLERELGFDKMRMPNVGGTSAVDAVAPVGGGVEGGQPGGSVVPPGSAVDVGNEPGAGAAAAAPGGGTVQPAAETPGIVPTALTPTKVWTGRRGDGYATIGDANTALQSKQTASSKEGGDGLTWTVVPQADGRYVLHGYAPQQATQPADSRIGSEAPAVPSASGEVGGTLVAGASPIAGGGNVNPSVNPGTASPVLAGSPQAADQAGSGVAAAGGGVLGGRAAAAVPAGTAAVGSPTAPVHGGGEQAASLIDPAQLAEDIRWVENDRLKKGEAIKLEVVTNEQDPTLANLATAMKAPIYFVRTKSGKSGFSGYARNGRIAINLSGKAAPVATVMHEAVHTMPAALRKALIDKVMPELSLGAREEFLRRYPAYANRPEDKIQEEIVAKLTENAVEEPAFWEDVKTKLGDNDFKGLVKHILSTLTRLIGAAKAHNNTDLARDWTKVRSLIAEATAKTMKGDTAWIEEATEDRATMEGVEVTEIDPDQVGDAEYAEEGKEPEPAAAAQGRQYNIGTERGNRAVAGFASLSDNEQAAIWAGAVELGLPERTIMSLLRSARSTKRRHPPRAGWAQIEAVGVEAVTEDDGTVKLDKTGKPVAEVKWKTIAYGFNVPKGAKKAPPKRDIALVNQVADQFKRMINDIFRRAAEGDQTAVNIIAHQTWYRGVAEVLRREFGAQGDLFADLLGATSPNTPVNTNWRFAIEILHRFSRGEFDTVMTDFIKYLEEGGSPDEYRKAGHEKIRQASGKLYGMNSVNSMIALANLWRNIQPGTSPKARNFALNLIGQSNMATIDVWAARMLRRAANSIRGMSLPRIPPPAEKGLTGKWNVDATDVGGEFGFGAAVLAKVSADLAAEGIEVSPPDLQAIAWFAEKELWTQNDWTNVAGEGGSFEENIEATPTNRFVFGFSVQQGNKRPEPGVPSAAQARILATIKGDDLVLSARIKPTYGMFMGKAEEAFDIEIVTKPGFDPSLMLSELSKLAKERTQSSVFISRVLGPTEKNSNARPGAEVYFKAGTKMAQIRDVMREFRLRGIDGFTLAVDPRAITVDKPAKEFVAVRVQYVPEYDESASPDTIDATLTQKTIELDAAVQALRQNPKVAFARAYQYDTEVLSGKTYDDYIDRAAGTDDRQAGGTPWPERSVRARLEGAAERIQSDARPVEGAAIPGAGGGQAQAAAEGNFSEDARPAEPPRGSSYRGAGSPGSGVRGAIEGVHYGRQQGLSFLSGQMFGQGIEGKERARLDAATDERIKRRVYFYLTNNGTDLPAPEAGLGQHVYRASLGNLYDRTTATREDRQRIQESRNGDGDNEFESAILDAGYRGFVNREQGTAVVLNSDVPVAYEGTIDWTRVRQRVNERIVPPIETREEGGELVRKITNEQMLGVIKARPELARVAPSFTMQYGEARVAAGEAAAANAALADSGLQFSEDRIDTPAFKRWFGDSKVVDAEGKPLVVYHGTDKGGFAEFRKPGGTRRGDLGIFATSNRHMAVSYVRRGRGQNMTFDDVGNDEVMPGVYPVYMSLQNPHEWDMDGANWDGSRPGMFEVYDADGEPVYSKDGNNYMELEEARKLASSVGGTFETFTPDVSTDQLVREARSMGNDGVIIRNVVDDGGGGNTFYAGEPADVYVAFEPNQIKAIFNTGTFDPATDDIRFSEDSRLPFYSALDRAIEGGPKQAPVEQWLAFIKGLTGKGVKPDEVFWSGIEDWLKLQTGKVQRDAVRGFLASSGVKVEEKILSSEGVMTEQKARDELAEKYFLKLDVNDRLRHIDEGDDYYDVDLASFAPKDRRAIQELVDVILDGGAKDAPKYDTYTLPGGKNYREVLLKLPSEREALLARKTAMEKRGALLQGNPNYAADRAEYDAISSKLMATQDYQSSHWDGHPNVIAHIRLNDRTIGGKKTLFVEELQSDWQQQRRKNLKIATTPMAMAGAEKQTPAAPFIDSTDKWLGLAIKRVLVEAVKGDYAQVAFVNGTQSADRYDLSKQIDAIDYRRITVGAADETDLHLVKNGSVIKTIAVKNADLENYVGKEMAKKIMANEGKQIEKNGFPMTRLDGLDLKIGGKGMITFYDSIVPTAANSLLKKLGGGKVAQISMPRYTVEPDGRGRWNVLEDGAIYENKPTEKIARALADRQNGAVPEQLAFDVTPELKAKVEEGLPLFSEDMRDTWAGYSTQEEMTAARAADEAQNERIGKAWERVRSGWPPIRPDDSQTPVTIDKPARPDPMQSFAGMTKEEYDARRAKLSFSEDATETPAFKRWFGDSKVVDAAGKPLVVYHGTRGDVASFAPDRVKGRFPNSEGFYFTSRPQHASVYADSIQNASEDFNPASRFAVPVADGANVMPAYVSLQNPKVVTVSAWGTLESRVDGDGGAMVRAAREAGHDGVIVTREAGDEWDGMLAIAFRPEQIKSAIGNTGTFDPANPDIRYSEDAQEPQYANNVAATRPRNVSSWAAGRDELGRFTFGPGAKAYEVAATIANNVLDVVKMKPISPELDRAMRKMKVEIEKAQMTAVDVANKLKEIPRDELEMISDVIEGELKAGVTPPQRVYDIAASMIEIMREQSTELVRLGMLSAEAVGRWDGKYLPRFYEQKLLEDLKAWKKMAAALTRRTGVMQGVAGKSLKARGKFETVFTKDLPIWIQQGWEVRDDKFQKGDKTVQVWRDYTKKEREDMGEVRDAMFRFIMGYTRTQRDIQLGRLFERLATDVAVRGPREGYVEVPSTKIEGTFAPRYGKLAGMYVPTEVLDHLKSYDDAMHSEILKMYRKGLSLWKEGKTVLNPVAHANNVISNLTMAHFAGVSYWDVNKYAGAVKDLTKNAPMVQEAKDAGLFLGTFSQGELVAAMPEQLRMLAGRVESRGAKTVETVWNAMSFWLRKPMGKAYEAEDQFFRYLIYRDARNKGASPDDAVDYAQRYIFTYDNLPSGAKLVRDVGLPFFAYTYKAVPAILRTAMEYPWRFAAPAGAFWAVNTLMYAMAFVGDDDDDDVLDVIGKYATDPQFRESVKAFEKDERKNLPPWMKGMSMTMFTPKAIRLGMDEVTNMPVFLDISRIFPGGDLLDANNNSGGMPIFQPLMPGNPVLTTAMAMLGNKDMFFGKEIVDKDLDTDTEAAAKRAAWMWRQVAPAIAVGNYHWDRAANALANITGEPIELGPISYTGQDRSGNPVQWEYAAMQTFGIKARPIDLELSEIIGEANKKRIIRELTSEIKKINRLENNGFYSETNAERMRENAKMKRDRIRSGLNIEGGPIDGEEEETTE